MDIIHFRLLCLIIFVTGTEFHDEILVSDVNNITQKKDVLDKFQLSPLRQLKMTIVDDSALVNVNLRQVQRSLANEHLLVWNVMRVIDWELEDDVNNYILKQNYNVMKKLGNFTIYQELQTSSAAIYFHERREFDGMINTNYLIQKLSIKTLHKKQKTIHELNKTGIYRQELYAGHLNDNKGSVVEDPKAGINYQQDMKTYKGQLYDGYPEVLVVVSWGMVEELTRDEPQSNRDVAIVSYVLTLFNGVDMLFSTLKSTKIQINIAGVIIPAEPDSLDFLNNCSYIITTSDNIVETKEAKCSNGRIREFVRAHKEDIPVDSYDVVIFLTEANLMSVNEIDDEKKVSHLAGLSTCFPKLFECRMRGLPIALVASVRNVKKLSSYPTITHEIAHLLTVGHDKLPYFTYKGECCGNLMRTDEDWCEKCISWSETSEKSFFALFSSPNCCTFINKPRSLLPPGQHEMLTADTQCQCYGYQSSLDYSKTREGFCSKRLYCLDEHDQFYLTTVPMDGTPCNDQKVCWQMSCKKIGSSLSLLFAITNYIKR